MTRAAAVESEDEFVEIALEMFPAQAVVGAERPGLQVGEDAMDPGQHDMGGHFADDMGIVGDVGRAWIGCPSVGFDGQFALSSRSSVLKNAPTILGMQAMLQYDWNPL